MKQMTPDQEPRMVEGFAHFYADLSQRVEWALEAQTPSRRFVLEISDVYAFIRLRDLRRPLQFFKQLSGEPPLKFGTQGFKMSLVDDKHPARHYTAFVFVGYWLPAALALLTLWAWEILGFVRYGGHWSQPDLRCGIVGIRHGRRVRRYGPGVLPGLIKRDLAELEPQDQPDPSQ